MLRDFTTDDNKTTFDKDEATRRMVAIADASEGKGSDVCDTGTRRLVSLHTLNSRRGTRHLK